jgi:predicted transcriptional regulator
MSSPCARYGGALPDDFPPSSPLSSLDDDPMCLDDDYPDQPVFLDTDTGAYVPVLRQFVVGQTVGQPEETESDDVEAVDADETSSYCGSDDDDIPFEGSSLARSRAAIARLTRRRPSGRHITRDLAIAIHMANIFGGSQREIAKELKLSRGAVSRVLERNQATPQQRKKTTALTPQVVDKIVEFVSRGPKERQMTFRELASGPLQELQLSYSSIKRALNSRGYGRFPAQRLVVLSEATKAARLAFAIMWVNMPVQWWLDFVIFTDEVWVRGSAHRALIVTRTREERFHPDTTQKRVQNSVGFMLWGAIRGGEKLSRVVWQKHRWGNITAKSFCEHILPEITRITREQDHFQQDNATSHKAKMTQEHMRQAGVQVMKWPPSSPDLNPIELAWQRMKDDIQKEVGGEIISSRVRVEALITTAWERAVTSEKLIAAVSRMPRLLQLVIEEGGGHIQHRLKN